MGRQERQEAKKERETSKKEDVKGKKAKEAEEAAWADAGPSKSKAAAKKEDEERKRAEAAAKKAEAKRLLEEEEARLASSSKPKPLRPAAPKITKYELDKTKEEEAREKDAAAREKALAAKREMTEDAYASMVATENANRLAEEENAARSVAEALSVLGVKEAAEVDKHPEKRMRSAWLAYEEKTMPLLKEEKPGLKMSQYKDLLWKMWQKAPENPMNQTAAAR